MITITKPVDLQNKALSLKREGKKIGLVPTMGFLHEGHMSLIGESKKKTDLTIVTIFVNPTQFGENEDYGKYPRDLERDKNLLVELGTDILFTPDSDDIYGDDYHTYINVEELSDIMCGKSRPIHFKGVCTIVNKLFNLAQPDIAFFGKKDYQQYVIIKRMSKDLNIPIDIAGCPIIREKDGLAMSSRNKYLSDSERKSAKLIYKTLKDSADKIKEGISDIETLCKKSKKTLLKDENIGKVDYYDFRDPENLSLLNGTRKQKEILIATAVWVGSTRLIDNIVIRL